MAEIFFVMFNPHAGWYMGAFFLQAFSVHHRINKSPSRSDLVSAMQCSANAPVGIFSSSESRGKFT